MNHSEVLGFDASNMVFSTPRRPMTFAIMSARIESACLQTSSASIIIMSAPASKHLSALLINRSTSSTNSAERNRGNAHLISYNHTSDFILDSSILNIECYQLIKSLSQLKKQCWGVECKKEQISLIRKDRTEQVISLSSTKIVLQNPKIHTNTHNLLCYSGL